MTPKHGKRDANEREIVEAWRALGALWIPQPQESGFDGILLFRGQVHIVEIKDTRFSNGRFSLTKNERETLEEVGARGVEYKIVTNMIDALELVGAG